MNEQTQIAAHLRSPFKNRYDNFIGGAFVPPVAGRYFDNVTPITGAVVCEVARSDKADVELALDAAHAAKDAWGKTSAAERSNILLRIADRMEANLEVIATAETWDNGKPIRETMAADIPLAIDHFRYFAGVLRGQEGTMSEIDHDTVAYHFHEPLGVVGQIIPWNFSILMAAWKLAPALAAGNCIVMKPAEQTPAAIMVLMELIADLLPAGTLNIVNGYGAEAGDALARSTRIAKIAFTGSTATGRKLIEAAAGNLKKLTLELGGKSPFIVLEDADIEAALDGAMRGVFANGGQVCVSGSRIYVSRANFDRFVDGLAEKAAAMRLGHGLDEGTQMGPLIHPAHAAKVADYVVGAAKDGAAILTGGGLDGPHESFVHPAVIANPKADSALMREEVFGPVAAVSVFDDLDDVVRQANDTRYGLAASVWTQDLSDAHRLSAAIKAGTVWINGHSYFSPELPKGGWRESGWGVENNAEGLDNYLQTKTVCSII